MRQEYLGIAGILAIPGLAYLAIRVIPVILDKPGLMAHQAQAALLAYQALADTQELTALLEFPDFLDILVLA